jgi:CheY-like chemotaxis protein
VAPIAEGLADLKVLVIDDNASSRRIAAHYLRAAGAHCDTAGSGGVGLDLTRGAVIEGNPYDVVLVDYRMAEMDGTSFIRHLRGDPSIADSHCVLMRAHGERPVELGGMDAADCITKPLRKADLYGVVARAGVGAKHPEDAEDAEPETPASVATGQYPHARVLVAEDNRVNQEVALRMLKTFGIHARVAANGEIALAMIKSDHFDLVLMDCQMPVMDGYATARAIRLWEQTRACGETSPSRLPIVAMTANALAGDREECIAAGMDDYVSKPMKRESLALVFASWLS